MKEINAEIVSHKFSELPADLAIDIASAGENFGAPDDSGVTEVSNLLDVARSRDNCVVSTVYVDGQIKLVVAHSSGDFKGKALACGSCHCVSVS